MINLNDQIDAVGAQIREAGDMPPLAEFIERAITETKGLIGQHLAEELAGIFGAENHQELADQLTREHVEAFGLAIPHVVRICHEAYALMEASIENAARRHLGVKPN